jgi:hydroxymethylglutaryl-CoA lyase
MMAEKIRSNTVKLVECPRDAMQGWSRFIPSEKKITYLNTLMQVGFDSLDFGSFVSPKAIPQMADTKEVIEKIVPGNSSTRLLAIVANSRGAEAAALYPVISDIGYPFSISETFQERNANSSIAKSVETVSAIQEICFLSGKRLVVYISMAFGNPYGDEYSPEIALQWIQLLAEMGIGVISLADTVGLATPEQVNMLTKSLIDLFPSIETGVHMHSRPENRWEKIEAACSAGCRRFDGAINGIGGCPMAGDDLVGNMDSLLLIDYFRKKNLLPALNEDALKESILLAGEIFSTY